MASDEKQYPLNPFFRRDGELDTRHRDIGLTDTEANYILSVCKKYQNYRDELDDLYQTCLLAILDGFRRQERRQEPILHRKGYIRRVCHNILKYKFVKAGRGDFFRHCVSNTHNFFDMEDGDDGVSVLLISPTCPEHLRAGVQDPFAIVEWGVILDEVYERILDPTARRILHLAGVEGLTQMEIAQRLNMKHGEVAKIMRASRRAVAEALIAQGVFEEERTETLL